MPFDQLFPRAFTAASVRMYAPALPGVYGISNAREWLQIGSAENLQEELLRILVEGGTSMRGQAPTGFSYETCEVGAREPRRRALELEYAPGRNREAGGR
ncbi:MAG: hypothetical protein HY821_26020 [Acidobacteria bacterium]|nr:hypothetical protein [Acidobacteriota bacterium]